MGLAEAEPVDDRRAVVTVRTVISHEIERQLRYRRELKRISTFTEVGADDPAVIENVRGVRAYWVARGGTIDHSRVASYRFEPGRDTIGFHVSEPSRRISSIPDDDEDDRLASKLAQPVRQAMDLEVLNRVFRLAEESADGEHPVGTPTAGDRVRSIAASGGHPVVIGWSLTQAVLNDLYTDAGTIVCQVNELFPTYVDFDLPFDPTRAVVYARESMRFTQWGSFFSKEWDATDAWEWHVMGGIDLGAVMLDNATRVDLKDVG